MPFTPAFGLYFYHETIQQRHIAGVKSAIDIHRDREVSERIVSEDNYNYTKPIWHRLDPPAIIYPGTWTFHCNFPFLHPRALFACQVLKCTLIFIRSTTITVHLIINGNKIVHTCRQKFVIFGKTQNKTFLFCFYVCCLFKFLPEQSRKGWNLITASIFDGLLRGTY